jgi:hypothetical protein
VSTREQQIEEIGPHAHRSAAHGASCSSHARKSSTARGRTACGVGNSPAPRWNRLDGDPAADAIAREVRQPSHFAQALVAPFVGTPFVIASAGAVEKRGVAARRAVAARARTLTSANGRVMSEMTPNADLADRERGIAALEVATRARRSGCRGNDRSELIGRGPRTSSLTGVARSFEGRGDSHAHLVTPPSSPSGDQSAADRRDRGCR